MSVTVGRVVSDLGGAHYFVEVCTVCVIISFCHPSLYRERDALHSEVEALQKSLQEQEAREHLIREDLERSTKEVG